MKHRMPLTPEQREFLRDQPNQMLTIDETLALLHESRSSFYNRHPLAKRRIKLGRNSYWSKEVILAWIREQSEAANNAA